MTLCSEAERFSILNRIDASGDCWEWTGAHHETGYGRWRLGGNTGQLWYAHRLLWVLLVGPIPDGYQIDHLCRNRNCVNPDHLEAVTQQVNLSRQVQRGRFSDVTHCQRGHEYTTENTYVDPKRGWRQCRSCIKLRQPHTLALQRERRRRNRAL